MSNTRKTRTASEVTAAELAKDERALNKKRINPDIRAAESRYVATMLRGPRPPQNDQFVDVQVSGKIIEWTGAKLALQVTVKDSTGRAWISNRRYESLTDTGSYKTDAALKTRDPFANVYAQVADEMLMARDALAAQHRPDIRRVTQLEFARDLAPQAMDGYLDPNGTSGGRCGGKDAETHRNRRGAIPRMAKIAAPDVCRRERNDVGSPVAGRRPHAGRSARHIGSGALNEMAIPEPN
jgi:hypothetical protein